MEKITIDGMEYAVDSLSDDAKGQLVSIQAVDKRLNDLKEQAAILQTARIGYVTALRQACLAQPEAAIASAN